MLKFALALGISYVWLFGESVTTPMSFVYAALHALCATLLAWMILESLRTLYLGAMSLDGTPPARHAGGPRGRATR